ncbi:MAG: hypothetical protein WA789_04645 [Candidatus Acidiferrum sp.]
MLIRAHGRGWRQRGRLLGGVCAMLCLAAFVATAGTPDQPAGDAVGLIEGEDISVTGPMSVEVVGGQVKTILRSGSDVRVKSGVARISLVEGGQISICGPAHLSVLKSGASLTVALESGAIHARLEQEPALTVYTAQIQAQTVAIGDDPREILVGFENPGLMCIRTYRGAIRVEQQLSGRSVIVPQGEDVMLANGQIDALSNGAGHCNCDLQIAKAPVVSPLGNGISATAQETAKGETAQDSSDALSTAASEKPATKEEPIYQVDMPPLRFDANARVQPEPDPSLMVIVRRVRVRPTLIFQGRVEGEPVAEAAAARPAPIVTAPKNTQPPSAQGSVVDRVRSFFRRLWSKGG